MQETNSMLHEKQTTTTKTKQNYVHRLHQLIWHVCVERERGGWGGGGQISRRLKKIQHFYSKYRKLNEDSLSAGHLSTSSPAYDQNRVQRSLATVGVSFLTDNSLGREIQAPCPIVQNAVEPLRRAGSRSCSGSSGHPEQMVKAGVYGREGEGTRSKCCDHYCIP